MVPPSAYATGKSREIGEVRGEVTEGRADGSGQELLELDELAVSFLPDEEVDEPESLFDDESDDFDSEPEPSLLVASAPLLAPDFEDRLSVL
jgi:hypothetical protein